MHLSCKELQLRIVITTLRVRSGLVVWVQWSLHLNLIPGLELNYSRRNIKKWSKQCRRKNFWLFSLISDSPVSFQLYGPMIKYGRSANICFSNYFNRFFSFSFSLPLHLWADAASMVGDKTKWKTFWERKYFK